MIRPFKPYDLPEILDIEGKAFPKTAYTTSTFMAFYCQFPEGFQVWEADSVVGYIMFKKNGHILSIAVHPDHRRKGIGTKLLEHVAEGCERLSIEVRESNTGAQEFYKARGFELDGKREGYYKDESALVFSRKG